MRKKIIYVEVELNVLVDNDKKGTVGLPCKTKKYLYVKSKVNMHISSKVVKILESIDFF